jgi:transcriptional regulator of acetoin/glycerol metabolism
MLAYRMRMGAYGESASRDASLVSLFRAVIEATGEGVVVFDRAGRLVYASASAHRLVEAPDRTDFTGQMMSRLLERGGRRVPLRLGTETVGEAIFLRAPGADSNLAERERRAILETLRQTGGRLAVAARHLGISRTTLWRRLKEYGVTRE